MAGLPEPGAPEVCFGGRSNVGKSSLLNALCRRRQLARTSNTPGRTQLIHFYALGEALTLVDLPGYGYAKASREKVGNWTRLVRDYLAGRAPLRRALVLVDARRGIGRSDAEVMDLLDTAAVAYQVVLTKADKPRPGELARCREAVEEAVSARPAAMAGVIATSAAKGDGVAELRDVLAGIAAAR